ncbi:MAG: universal stress protein UspA [Dyadobacter sp. 50-39]|uniref:universal stress protein n=1 Tax=Dyadobacter sp. 50-39 TaxID=1895756 RepID=UPI00095C5B5A|nr:universal stress protein [Dyadobacter sp. 50-39]OJV21759.1 MAG: universal stress protein UspA [Dyadobacter sp. 50-39]
MDDSADILRILVPFDCSQAGRLALQATAEFEWQMPVKIFVLTVEEDIGARAQPVNAGSELSQWISAFPPAIKIHPLHVTGRFVDSVLDVVDTHHIDLIVVGTRGARGWDGVFMGSHAERIVRVAPVPVLSIQQRPHFARTAEILVPVDIHSDPAELRVCLSRYSQMLDSRFHLLYIDTDAPGIGRASAQQLEEYAQKLALSHCVTSVVIAEDITEAILKFAAQIGADMIAMGTLGNPDPAHMFRPSITADVVNHARIPVLTCPLRQVLISH